jgi:hypothetical protein
MATDALNPSPAGPSRRALLLGVPATVTALTLTGLSATKADAANVVVPGGDDYVDQGFNALAAYVLPGNDPYSVQQANTSALAGGVAAGTADMLKATYDDAFNVSVAPTLGVNLPGAGGIAVVLDIATRGKYLLQSFGPFQHPFANLTYAQKAQVLAALDESTLLRGSPIGFAFGTFITLATLGAFTETAVFDPSTRRLTGIPVGWQRSKYGGVSNGWPEYKGYWQGRTSVSDPGKAV